MLITFALRSNVLKNKEKPCKGKTGRRKDMNNDSFRIFTAMKKKMNRSTSTQRNYDAGARDDRKRDHLVFFICLILATTFWFLIKLSDIYPVSYSLKIKYTHVPSGRLITSLKDSVVTVHFKSSGYNLLDLMIHRELDSLDVDLSQSNYRRLKGNFYAVTTASLREITAQTLGVNDRDLEFSKPQLTFYMERLHQIRKKVLPRLRLKFKSQYRLYGYKVHPAVVKVFGPKKVLDTLKTVTTMVVRLENLGTDRKTKVDIYNPLPKVLRFYPPAVNLDLDVEKYTERSMKIPVDVSGIQPAIKTFPSQITVNFNVFIRDYEKVHASQFRIVPNIRNINLKQVKTLHLQVVSAPKNVSNIRLVPPQVEFIIVN